MNIYPVPNCFDSDSAEYVQCLLAEELGSFASNNYPDKTKSLTVHACSLNPCYFTVQKMFSGDVVHKYHFEVKKRDSLNYLSEYVITGQAVLQHHKKEITFSSSYSFKKYLKDQWQRPLLSKEAEETAHYVDLLMQAYRSSLSSNCVDLLIQSRQNPAVVIFALPKSDNSIKELYFECQKTNESASPSGFKFTCHTASEKTTVYTSAALLNYLTCLQEPLEKKVPRRLYSTKLFKIAHPLQRSVGGLKIDFFEDQIFASKSQQASRKAWIPKGHVTKRC